MKKINVTKALLPELKDYVKELEDLWDSHQLTSKGSKHNTLLEAIKERLEVSEASLFVNGHLALEAILEAYELNGEIITTAFTFPSTTHAIVRRGCTPVFADIKADDFTLDPKSIETKITDKTVAILPVHILGNVCDVEAIETIAKKHNLKVIYDAAHVFGTKLNDVGVGNFGDASMFSMNATKVFNTIEGGLLTYKDKDLTQKLDLIKYYGMESSEDITYIGSNLKMNEFQAAMGICNLPLLKQEITQRKQIAHKYVEELSKIDGIKVPSYKSNIEYNYAYFPILINHPTISRDEVYESLKDKGINAKKYFYPLVTDYACYKGKYDHNLPISRIISEQALCLPLYGEMTEEEVTFVMSAINQQF
ncbi:MAG: DegT/DnrJ/EryC1/StrS family aminotransferase [Trichloromonadaceae bacterium]